MALLINPCSSHKVVLLTSMLSNFVFLSVFIYESKHIHCTKTHNINFESSFHKLSIKVLYVFVLLLVFELEMKTQNKLTYFQHHNHFFNFEFFHQKLTFLSLTQKLIAVQTHTRPFFKAYKKSFQK